MNESPSLSLKELKAALAAVPADAQVRVVLPSGDIVPAHFHLTEVGRVQKDFVDCGGQWHASRSCVLQLWLGAERDDGHRLEAGKFRRILGVAARLFPDESVAVEVEYERTALSQFPLASAAPEDGELVLRLLEKHTDCLARRRAAVDAADDGGCGCGSSADAGSPCCG